MASKDVQDYLWTIRETMGRVSEINRLCWDDIDLKDGYITLYTRKKGGGHLTPRRIWMTGKLHSILSDRYDQTGLISTLGFSGIGIVAVKMAPGRKDLFRTGKK